MDPIELGLFPDMVDLNPVIRLVFALAAINAGVDLPKARQCDHHHFDEFTALDVWCAGLGDTAFKHVDNDLRSYQLLLDRSLRPHDVFDLQDGGKSSGHDDARRLRGPFRRRVALLTTDNDAHHAICLRGSGRKGASGLWRRRPRYPPYTAFELSDDGKGHEETRLVKGSSKWGMAPLIATMDKAQSDLESD